MEALAPIPVVGDDVGFERVWLDERSWVDVARGWVSGADALFDTVRDGGHWRQGRLWRYDHWVEEPRMGASARRGGAPLDPVLPELTKALRRKYRVDLDGPAVALYRDGNDGVAFHRDRELRWLDDTVIAVLSLGQQRPWFLRPRANRYAHTLQNQGATHDIAPASGDLLVMGGRCQADWEHSVPRVHGAVDPRISLQWRWTSRRGRPVTGGNYRDPRFFSR